MANAKKKWIACKGNLTIPAEMAGEERAVQVQDGQPVQVPAFYADSLVQDGIAEHCEAPKKKPADPTAEEKAAAEKAARVKAAQTAVTDAQAALNAAEGTNRADGARATLLAAQEALAALKD
tara:strand:+ start:366 stop:731 length:366 start_codon:yes stop_codon:yes gene_type:complete